MRRDAVVATVLRRNDGGDHLAFDLGKPRFTLHELVATGQKSFELVMSKANAFSTFGTKPSFSLLRSKKAAIAGVSLAGFSLSAVISVSSAIAVRVIAVRGALPRLVGSVRRFGADLV